MDDAGIVNVTPHRFRCTVAIAIHEIGGLLLASGILGHTTPQITLRHHIRRNEVVNPLTAEMLDLKWAWR